MTLKNSNKFLKKLSDNKISSILVLFGSISPLVTFDDLIIQCATTLFQSRSGDNTKGVLLLDYISLKSQICLQRS